MAAPRDYGDPRVKLWRKRVFARDRWRCRMPGCRGGGEGLNAHHVRCWSSNEALRFVVGNGITLCRPCHLRVRGHEAEFEATFAGVIAGGAGAAGADLRVLFLRRGKGAGGG